MIDGKLTRKTVELKNEMVKKIINTFYIIGKKKVIGIVH